MADKGIISYSDLISDDGTFDDISKLIARTKKELLDLAKVLDKDINLADPNDLAMLEKLEKQTKELVQAQKNLTKSEQTLAKAKKKNIELTQEELIQIESEKLARREQRQIAKQQAIILKEEKNSIAAIRAQLSLTTIQWKKLTAEEAANSKEGRELVAQKKRLTEQLKRLEKATGDNRREVGNYSKATKGLRKTLVRLFVGRTIIDGVLRLGSALGEIVEKGKDNNESFQELSDSFTILKQNLTTVATVFLNFIAGPLSGLFNTLSFIVSKLVDFGSALFNGAKAILDFGRSFEFVNRIVTGFTDILFNIPAVFAGIVAAAGDFASTTINVFRRLALELEKTFLQIQKVNPFSSQSVDEIDRAINRLASRQTALINETVGVQKAFNDAYDATTREQAEFTAQQEVQIDNSKKLEDAETKRLRVIEEQERRLKAITELQSQLDQAETDNIEDKQERLIALEELRFKEEQALRVANFEAFKKENADQEEDIRKFKELSNKLAQEQEIAHQKKLIEIKKQFNKQAIEIDVIDVTQEDNTEVEALLNEEVKLVEDSNQKIEDSSKELLNNIGKTAELISQEITKIFEKQADLAAESVNQQQENLSRAREKAAQGLKSDIAFEEKELAKRQAEQQRREKEAAQAAKLLTLFNLVSAYAQNGDENALARGLVDFALLEAFSAGLEGFFEGTEDTGRVSSPLDGKGGRLAILHDNERVMTKAQNVLLNGMSNDDVVTNALIGSQMSDNYNPQSITSQNLFTQQKADFIASVGSNQESFNSNARIEKALINIERQLSNQPNIGLEMEKMYNNMYDIIKTEIKNSMKKRSRKRLGK